MDFFISSYTMDPFLKEKIETTKRLLLSIRKYFPESRIILCDSCEVANEIPQYCDFYIWYKQSTKYNYHGQYHLDKIKFMIQIGDFIGTESLVSCCYDYIINDNLFDKIKDWPNLLNNKFKAICSSWAEQSGSNPGTISTGFGGYSFDIYKRIYQSIEFSSQSLEHDAFNKLTNYLNPDQYIIYSSIFEMTNTMERDFFNNGGTFMNSRLELLNDKSSK